MPSSILSKKGRITIPVEIRNHLKLRLGEKIEFVVQRDGNVELIGTKIDVRQLRGILGPVRKRLTIRQMDAAIKKCAAERDRSSRSRSYRP